LHGCKTNYLRFLVSSYIRIKVRGYHLDQHGHLNNHGYTSFLEEARWALFENYNAIEFFSQIDLTLTLVNCNINYRRPCFFNDALEIHTKVMRIGNTSCKIDQTIYIEGSSKIIADASNTFVLMDNHEHKAIPIRGQARDKLAQLADSA
jgi:thioesterase-3